MRPKVQRCVFSIYPGNIRIAGLDHCPFEFGIYLFTINLFFVFMRTLRLVVIWCLRFRASRGDFSFLCGFVPLWLKILNHEGTETQSYKKVCLHAFPFFVVL